jgi:hypothetical protein
MLSCRSPKVFEGAAAAGYGHQFRPGIPAEVIQAAADFFHRSFALYQRGEKADVKTGETAGQDLDHVGDDGAAAR